jgi:hypothetical protein
MLNILRILFQFYTTQGKATCRPLYAATFSSKTRSKQTSIEQTRCRWSHGKRMNSTRRPVHPRAQTSASKYRTIQVEPIEKCNPSLPQAYPEPPRQSLQTQRFTHTPHGTNRAIRPQSNARAPKIHP